MTFVAVDFETSGLDSKRHAPIQVGIALMTDTGRVLSEYQSLIRPTLNPDGSLVAEYDQEALKISGTTMDQLMAAPDIKTVVREMTQLGLSHHTVVSYNVRFDYGFYRRLIDLAGNPWGPLTMKYAKWECALVMARKTIKCPDYRLATVVKHLCVGEQADIHGALPDAILAGKAYARLCRLQEVDAE